MVFIDAAVAFVCLCAVGSGRCMAAYCSIWRRCRNIADRSDTGILAALGFCGIPANIGTLAGTFAFILPAGLVGLAAFFSGLWVLVLIVLALQANYGLSIGRSIAAVLLPIIFLAGVFVLFCVYVVVSVASVFM